MINAKTELQYQIALGILTQMRAAGFVTEDEAESIRHLAMEKYRVDSRDNCKVYVDGFDSEMDARRHLADLTDCHIIN